MNNETLLKFIKKNKIIFTIENFKYAIVDI